MAIWSRFLTPGVKIIIWFIVPILLGTSLLMLPISSEGTEIAFIDALFTSTSAFCVTGLTVVNIPNTFSMFGEIVLIVLMQLGGLGVMAFSTLFFFVLRGRFSIDQVMDLRSTFTSDSAVRVRALLKTAFLVTVIVEGIGVLLLFIPLYGSMSAPQALYSSIFHAVSAFNNAGLSIAQNNLQDYHTNAVIIIVVAALIIVGGLGFTVNLEIFSRLRNIGRRRRLSLHSKLTVMTTVILIIAGTIIFVLLEMNGAYRNETWGQKILDGFFQSVTPRTAGFDSVPQNSLSIISILMIIMLMVIGASPGSTGGGIKTTSFAIIVMAIVSRIRGKARVDIFRRTVALDSVIRAISIFILAVLLIFAATVMIMLFESGFHPTQSARGSELDYLFEVVSAFGTVGLSLGITPLLHTPGKLILIVMMIIGRVGLLTMFYVVARRESAAPGLVYSEENVMIG